MKQLNVQGQTYFNKVYDNDTTYDFNYNIIQKKNGEYILVQGSQDPFTPVINSFIYSFDQNGDSVWSRMYNFSPTGGETFRDITELSDGNFVAGGMIQDSVLLRSNLFAFKFDTIGNVIWKQQYGTPFNDYCQSMQKCSDGGFIISGSNYDSLNTILTANLVKIDSVGSLVWNKHYTAGTTNCEFFDAKQTSDGGFIAAGQVRLNANDRSCYLVKTDMDGDTLWTKIFNVGNTKDVIFGIDVMFNGDIILCGGMIVNNGPGRGYVMRCDSIGNLIWDKNFVMGPYDAEFQDVFVDSNQNIYCVGEHFDLSLAIPRPSGWLTKIDYQTGDTIWNRTYRYFPLCDHYLYSVNRTNDMGFIMGGWTLTNCNSTLNDIWIVKVDSNGCDVAGCFVVGMNEVNKDAYDWKLFPNPASSQFTVELPEKNLSGKIILMDELSRVVDEMYFDESSFHFFDTRTMSQGLYNCILIVGDGEVYSKKVMIVH